MSAGVLERIASALEAIAAGGGGNTLSPAAGGAAAAVAETPAEPAAPAGPTEDDVRTALKSHAKVYGRDSAVKVLADHGAESIAKLAEEKYADVLKALGDG